MMDPSPYIINHSLSAISFHRVDTKVTMLHFRRISEQSPFQFWRQTLVSISDLVPPLSIAVLHGCFIHATPPPFLTFRCPYKEHVVEAFCLWDPQPHPQIVVTQVIYAVYFTTLPVSTYLEPILLHLGPTSQRGADLSALASIALLVRVQSDFPLG